MKPMALKIGDCVRVASTPRYLVDDRVMNTKSVFEMCVGKLFTVKGFYHGWIELSVGEVTGKQFETIYIEPECLELVSDGSKR